MNGIAQPVFRRESILSLFFISLFGISFETFLTRYFAIANFYEYGYWVISIVMVGYSVSGVILSMFESFFYKHRKALLFFIPALMMAFTLLAFYLMRHNPFNPLEIQSEVMWKTQISFIFQFYLALFPVFFLAGLFISLNFVIYYREIPKVYAFDLLGAAAGAVVVLVAEFFVHPYHMLAVIIPVLLFIVIINMKEYFGSLKKLRAWAFIVVCVFIAVVTVFYIVSVSPLSFPFFKGIYAVLNIEGNTIIQSIINPAGVYLVMDNFTERNAVDLSNNYKTLGISGPPKSYGIYKDGRRISPLLKEAGFNYNYVKGSLAYFPYLARPDANVLLLGTAGGYRIVEDLNLPIKSLDVIEQEVPLYGLVKKAINKNYPTMLADPRLTFDNTSVFSWLGRTKKTYDIIDIDLNYLGQNDINRFAFTTDAIDLYLDKLSPNGIISIPVRISEFNFYALKTVNTVLTTLEKRGYKNPEKYVMVYRSTWTAQILVSKTPFSASDISAMQTFCSDRSFDTPYFPGIDPSKITVWNELAPVSFDSTTAPVFSAEPQNVDAVMDDLGKIFSGDRAAFFKSHFFNLAPMSINRPNFYSITRLSNLKKVFTRISVLPQDEIGFLVNIVIIVQAIILAVIILILPLFVISKSMKGLASTSLSLGNSIFLFIRVMLYFSALGLGFLFIELALIEKFSFYLENSSVSFAIILAGMLVFSGLGSFTSGRFQVKPFRGLIAALVVIAATLLFIIFLVDPILKATLGLPALLKILVSLAIVAPLAFALGFPFSMGNSSLGKMSEFFLPWAWAINGAFSVISTPLANILAIQYGWGLMLIIALGLYITTLITFPVKRPSFLPENAASIPEVSVSGK